MISKEEVEKLAKLARLALTEAEKTQFQGEIDAILGFVGQVKEAAEEAPKPEYAQANVMRDDVVSHKTGEYTDRLLDSAPERVGDFVKVKRILE